MRKEMPIAAYFLTRSASERPGTRAATRSRFVLGSSFHRFSLPDNCNFFIETNRSRRTDLRCNAILAALRPEAFLVSKRSGGAEFSAAERPGVCYYAERYAVNEILPAKTAISTISMMCKEARFP